MINIVYYYNPICFDYYTVSVDNIVIDFDLIDTRAFEDLKLLFKELTTKCQVFVANWSSFSPGTFQQQFSIRLPDGRSFWVGCVLNSVHTIQSRYRLEANPNKVGDTVEFQTVLNFFITNSSMTKSAIKRFDMAIDLPIPRERCFLIKDRRMYLERRHGQEWTQYLGSKSSAVGRVKLYNKSIESDLTYPLTRLELTLDPTVPYGDVNFPRVYFLLEKNPSDEPLRVTSTEKFILNAILQGSGTLTDLGRKTRAKIERLMSCYVSFVEIPEACYCKILQQLHSFLN